MYHKATHFANPIHSTIKLPVALEYAGFKELATSQLWGPCVYHQAFWSLLCKKPCLVHPRDRVLCKAGRSRMEGELRSLKPHECSQTLSVSNIHTYLHACMQTYIHTYIPTYIHTYIHTYVRTHARTHIHTYTST